MKKQILFFAMGAAIMCGCTSGNKQTNAMTDNSNLNHDSLTLVIGSYAQSNEEGIKVLLILLLYLLLQVFQILPSWFRLLIKEDSTV